MARLNAHFWNWIAKRYEKGSIADHDAYQKKLEMTRKYLNPDMQIAEIACGTGSTAIAQAPYVKHIHASDISTNMLAIAQDKAKAQNISNITFTHSMVENLNHKNDSLDMVMAHSILHLLKNKDKVISNIFAMLKPGGTFVSSTDCISNLWAPKIFLPIGNFLGLMPLVNFLSPDQLRVSILNAGFEIMEQWQPNHDSAVFIIAQKPR